MTVGCEQRRAIEAEEVAAVHRDYGDHNPLIHGLSVGRVTPNRRHEVRAPRAVGLVPGRAMILALRFRGIARSPKRSHGWRAFLGLVLRRFSHRGRRPLIGATLRPYGL